MSASRDRLTLYPPRTDAVARLMDSTREHIIQLGELIERTTPTCREQSLALTHLEEVCFWTIASIARWDCEQAFGDAKDQPCPATEETSPS